ncbi:MAG: hypothetical protein GTO02_21165, partial [Candidatus Dadabacteria bacterium]|nr:hypothetical protein [Candidatus Dadabacteria bacterium]
MLSEILQGWNAVQIHRVYIDGRVKIFDRVPELGCMYRGGPEIEYYYFDEFGFMLPERLGVKDNAYYVTTPSTNMGFIEELVRHAGYENVHSYNFHEELRNRLEQNPEWYPELSGYYDFI